MFENPRRGKQARNFTTNVPKILDLKSSSKQIFSENWRWVPLIFAVFAATKTGRPRIQRQEWQLILAPDVNDLGHVALFVKAETLRWTHMVAFLIAGFFVRASEWSEFTYGAKGL